MMVIEYSNLIAGFAEFRSVHFIAPQNALLLYIHQYNIGGEAEAVGNFNIYTYIL